MQVCVLWNSAYAWVFQCTNLVISSMLLHVLVILLTFLTLMSFQMHNYYILYMALAMALHVTFKEFVANLCYCTPHKHNLLPLSPVNQSILTHVTRKVSAGYSVVVGYMSVMFLLCYTVGWGNIYLLVLLDVFRCYRCHVNVNYNTLIEAAILFLSQSYWTTLLQSHNTQWGVGKGKGRGRKIKHQTNMHNWGKPEWAPHWSWQRPPRTE